MMGFPSLSNVPSLFVRSQEFLSPPLLLPLPPVPSHSQRYASCLSSADSAAILAAMASALPAALQLLPSMATCRPDGPAALPRCHAALPACHAALPAAQPPAVAHLPFVDTPVHRPQVPSASSGALRVPQTVAMVAHGRSGTQELGAEAGSGSPPAAVKAAPPVRPCSVVPRKPTSESPSSVLLSPAVSLCSESPDATPNTRALEVHYGRVAQE